MKISVVITCFNLEKYIGQAIQSALNQSLSRDLYEIIVVDDCSTDKSAEVISLYNVKYVKPRANVGVLGAMLLGLQCCRGDIICFLDGDDTWASDKLRLVLGRFDDNKRLIFLTHGYHYMNSYGDYVKGLEWTQAKLRGLEASELSSRIKEGILNRSNYVWLGSAFSIRSNTEIIRSFSEWANALPNKKCTYQDWTLAYWIAASGEGDFGYIDKPLLNYRIHGANYSGGISSASVAARNWEKSYLTSVALLDICLRFQIDRSFLYVCSERMSRDFIMWRCISYPAEIDLSMVARIFTLHLPFRAKLKDLIRLLLLRCLGSSISYRLINAFQLTRK